MQITASSSLSATEIRESLLPPRYAVVLAALAAAGPKGGVRSGSLAPLLNGSHPAATIVLGELCERGLARTVGPAQAAITAAGVRALTRSRSMAGRLVTEFDRALTAFQ